MDTALTRRYGISGSLDRPETLPKDPRVVPQVFHSVFPSAKVNKKRGRKPKTHIVGNSCFVWKDLTSTRTTAAAAAATANNNKKQ